MANARDRFLALISGRRLGAWPSVQRCGLRLASLPYGWVVRIRNWLFDWGWKRSYAVSAPVISVGNLTLGGTGKTPCVEYVARFYRQRGLRVAILSRGYGNLAGCNDEALVLEENLPDVPHLQGADRVTLANAAIEELESQVLVLDDGFQHRRLRRDLDVVLIDATNPWGHGRLFPRGLLREPRASLRRADLVVLTRSDQVSSEQLQKLRASIGLISAVLPVAETTHQPIDLLNSEGLTKPLGDLKEKRVAAFCGLGNPEAFRQTLLNLEATVCAFRSFPDHHPYSRSDVEHLGAWARQQAMDCLVVTTQKDLVKLRLTRLGGRDLFALRIRFQLTAGQEAFDQKLLSIVPGM
ncbi:MAG: tetraacyldisaccharide 4'-kinase [Gemmataceae bacterium]